MFFCSELHLPPCWTVSPWPSVTGSSVPATRTVKPLSLGGSFSNTTSPRAPSAGRHSESDRTSVAPPAASTKPNQTRQTKQSNHIKPYTCCDTTRVVDRHCQRLVYAYHKTTHMPPHNNNYYYPKETPRMCRVGIRIKKVFHGPWTSPKLTHGTSANLTRRSSAPPTLRTRSSGAPLSNITQITTK
jgi:hypothetical protein